MLDPAKARNLDRPLLIATLRFPRSCAHRAFAGRSGLKPMHATRAVLPTALGVQARLSCPHVTLRLDRASLNHEAPMLALTHAPVNISGVPHMQRHFNEFVTD